LFIEILEQLDHQRGRIITHASQSATGLEMVKQEHCGEIVGKFEFKIIVFNKSIQTILF
jgi:hypothetical protein